MTYKSVNIIFRSIALEQDIEIGTPEWTSGGLAAWSGSTGGHKAYGWRHDHLVKQQYARAVFANYCARPSFYLNAPVRHGDYNAGGRPIDWNKFELPDDEFGGSDLLGGYTFKSTEVRVTGPDWLHFQLSPLFSLIRQGEDITISAQGTKLPAAGLAREVVRMLMKSHAGMTKKADGLYNDDLEVDRGLCLFVRNVTDAVKHGAIDTEDFATLAGFVEQVILPFYEQGAGLSYNVKDPPFKDKPNIQLFNGLYWLLPVFYDAWIVCPPGDIKERLWKIILRWSHRMVALEYLKPGQGTMIWSVSFNEKPSLDMPWENILPEHCHIKTGPKDTDWSIWGLRAQLVAAKVLDSNLLKAAADKVYDKFKGKPSEKQWLVNAEGEYL